MTELGKSLINEGMEKGKLYIEKIFYIKLT